MKGPGEIKKIEVKNEKVVKPTELEILNNESKQRVSSLTKHFIESINSIGDLVKGKLTFFEITMALSEVTHHYNKRGCESFNNNIIMSMKNQKLEKKK